MTMAMVMTTADVMAGMIMAVVFMGMTMLGLVMYDPEPAPYMDGHY